MPNPTQGSVHINAPLTNVSVAYIQSEDDYIADKVFPRVPVQKQSDLYWKYNKAEWRRTDVEKRSPSTETPGVGWNTTTDQYFAHVYGVHKDIDDQLRSNADSNFNLDKEATQFVTMQLLLKRDIDWHAKFFNAAAWDGVGAFGAGKWDVANSTPIEDVTNAGINQRESTGLKPNIGVLDPRVFNVLRNHASIIERIKYTQRGVVTADLLASLFEIDKFYVCYATQNTGAEYDKAFVDGGDTQTTEEQASYSFIAGKHFGLFHAPSSPSLMTPSAGYTFTWNGYTGGNDRGVRIKRFRMEAIASDRIEGEMTYDQKIVAADCGTFFEAAIT